MQKNNTFLLNLPNLPHVILLYGEKLVSLHSKSIKEQKMKNKLQQIASELESINRDLRREEKVMQAELHDRQVKNLQGNDAIQHFNEWMAREGMNDLIIK